MTGRAEIVSLRDGVSSSYSCTTCCPHSHVDGWLDPGYFELFFGNGRQVNGKERQRDCYGNIYGPYDAGWGTWYAANPDIATVDSNGFVEGVDEGTAGFSFTWPVYYWMQDFDETCFPFESTESGGSTAEVTPAPHHLQIVSDTTSEFCTGGGPTSLRRQITYQVVDQYNVPITASLSIGERFFTLNDHTCGAGAPQASSCRVFASGQFTDELFAGCTPIGGSCGYDVLNQIVYCRSLGVPVPIGSLNERVHADQITVNGNSTNFPPGTYIYP